MIKRENRIYVEAAKMAAYIVAALVLCRLSHGAFTFVIAAYGAYCAISNRISWAIRCLVFLTFTVVVNTALVSKAGLFWSLGTRFGPLAIGLCLALVASRRPGRNRLPLGGLCPFLVCALISSTFGYVPQISYLKLINFTVFFVGIWFGTQNFQLKPREIEKIRIFFLGLIFLIVWGSLALLPFPGISYALSVKSVLQTEGAAAASFVAREIMAAGGKMLFCGILNHSQALSPILALSMGWLLCDMLFVERRFRVPHIATLVAMLPMLYLTRSRVALLTGACAFALIYFYTVNRIRIAPQIKKRLRQGMTAFCLLAVVMAGVSEVRDRSMSKWFRKTNDLAMDDRTTTEAFTESRQTLIEESMDDFRRNRLFGSGFQVAWYHVDMWQHSDGLVLSASIEKGVLPLMVLGETGIAGAVAFGAFLFVFYFACGKRKLYVTATLFTLLLVTNLGEATFFSPGGMGGVMWMLAAVGGFMIDTILLCRRLQERGLGGEGLGRRSGGRGRDSASTGDAERIPRLRGDAEGIPRLRGDAEGIPRLRGRRGSREEENVWRQVKGQ